MRLEAFNISKCLNNNIVHTEENIEDLLSKAERLLEIRKCLNFKLTHQLDAAEMIFHLAMYSDHLEQVVLGPFVVSNYLLLYYVARLEKLQGKVLRWLSQDTMMVIKLMFGNRDVMILLLICWDEIDSTYHLLQFPFNWMQ